MRYIYWILYNIHISCQDMLTLCSVALSCTYNNNVTMFMYSRTIVYYVHVLTNYSNVQCTSSNPESSVQSAQHIRSQCAVSGIPSEPQPPSGLKVRVSDKVRVTAIARKIRIPIHENVITTTYYVHNGFMAGVTRLLLFFNCPRAILCQIVVHTKCDEQPTNRPTTRCSVLVQFFAGGSGGAYCAHIPIW